MNKQKTAQLLVNLLKERYEKDIRDLPTNQKGVFKTLISTILSQRTREENTHAAASALFSKADTPEQILKLDKKKLKRLIKPSGMYNQKAKRIKAVCKILIKKHGGKVPRTREELMELPAVGFKTADVVLMYGHGIPSIAIDTHANRIPKRIGLVDQRADVEKVKEVLESLIPRKDWYIVNMGLVQFGREICKPIGPQCDICPMNKYCKYYKNVFKIQ